MHGPVCMALCMACVSKTHGLCGADALQYDSLCRGHSSSRTKNRDTGGNPAGGGKRSMTRARGSRMPSRKLSRILGPPNWVSDGGDVDEQRCIAEHRDICDGCVGVKKKVQNHTGENRVTRIWDGRHLISEAAGVVLLWAVNHEAHERICIHV
jgi:hypothetical protein